LGVGMPNGATKIGLKSDLCEETCIDLAYA